MLCFRSIQDSVANDYSWADNEYEKDIHEERPRRKENYKEDRRETQVNSPPILLYFCFKLNYILFSNGH